MLLHPKHQRLLDEEVARVNKHIKERRESNQRIKKNISRTANAIFFLVVLFVVVVVYTLLL
jgi:hypothetical protein